MSREILLIAEAVSNEKDVDKKLIFSAIEAALVTAYKKELGAADINVRVEVDPQTGDYQIFQRWMVIADELPEIDSSQEQVLTETLPEEQVLSLMEARKSDLQVQIGDVIEKRLSSPALMDFSRIATRMAKQVIIQKIREAERITIAQAYAGRVGELLTGVVKRVTRDGIILDLGSGTEGFIPREELIPREEMRVDDRVRAYLYEIQAGVRGPQLWLSRIRPEILIALFKIEVPEIAEELISIKGAARDPGLRAKIAVKTNDGRIDPIGACVGMRGTRVQAISGELNGERIDIVLWDENPAQFVINALSPAEVASIIIDEETHRMEVVVQGNQLSQAIGRSGQNVRLASELIGWYLDVITEEEAAEKSANESDSLQQFFIDQLEVDESIAQILVREGFTSLEEVAYLPTEEMATVSEFDEKFIENLRNRAKDQLLARVLLGEEQVSNQELLSLEGMYPELADILIKQGISTRDKLAELAIDDLLELVQMDREKAGQVIMAARAHWFNK